MCGLWVIPLAFGVVFAVAIFWKPPAGSGRYSAGCILAIVFYAVLVLGFVYVSFICPGS